MNRTILNKLRIPEPQTKKRTAETALIIFVSGIALGLFAKWLDNLALDSTIWWHRIIETLNLGNFFSDIAIWLFIALVIAAYSASALRAALNVFVFFLGMCASYHVSTILFSGFDPGTYMLIWYGITLLSPLLAVICWYAKGSGTVPLILDILITSIFVLSCFSIGILYVDIRGILYVLVFIGAVTVLYKSPKELLVTVLAGFLLAFLLNPVWLFY
ncbi:MAG: hypothetical protein IIZ27_07520 [Solobacterium sp.]|nr:hypothetical protein [Solobacterium sp.]